MIHLIHGFNENHKIGNPKIIRLEPLLHQRGFEVTVHDYGNLDLVAVRNNENLARLIFPQVKKGDSIIAFSNGCAIAARLARWGAPFKSMVFIQPALYSKWELPSHIDKLDVIWNEHDWPTGAVKYWRQFTGLFPWRWSRKRRAMWGDMGRVGYKGLYDSRIINHNSDSKPDSKPGLSFNSLPPVKGHTAWQESDQWLRFIAGRV